jgi:hypothetical protein
MTHRAAGLVVRMSRSRHEYLQPWREHERSLAREFVTEAAMPNVGVLAGSKRSRKA